MSELSKLSADDIVNHISNSCEGYQDKSLYFGAPWHDGETLYIEVTDDDENSSRTWALEIKEVL